MLDFRPGHRSKNYLQIPQQRKLLGLMAAAVLVMFLVSTAGDARRWQWMFGGPRGQADVRKKAVFNPDTRLAARAKDDDEPGTIIVPQAGLPPQAAEKPESFFPGVRTDYLQSVRDDTVFRKTEGDAWFHLLELLKKTDPQRLAEASTGKVSFRQLYQQPTAYRGRIVSLKGVVRGAVEKQAPKNTYGIEHYFQLSVEPDSEPDQLIVVYALELPAKFPLGDRIHERASIDGFFFKRWAYAASDAVRTAPLVLSRSIVWQPAPATVAPRSDVSPLMALLIAFGLFVVVAALYAVTRSRRSPPRAEEFVSATISPEVLAAMSEVDSGVPSESSRDLR